MLKVLHLQFVLKQQCFWYSIQHLFLDYYNFFAPCEILSDFPCNCRLINSLLIVVNLSLSNSIY